MTEIPLSVSGITFPLKEPVMVADKMRTRLPVHIYNQDPTMAPEGKTSVTIMLESDYDYWKKLAEDRNIYVKKKEETVALIINLLEQRFSGITGQVEVTDVATPSPLNATPATGKRSSRVGSSPLRTPIP
ncbi:MAG: hypothetical protein MZV63_39350 [Marinilabiliales bacterium]|nr:hypothetical protein [Marinilabiliales bacterium]